VAVKVEVVRSTRRRKTVSARMVGGALRVSIPSWMSQAEEQKWVDEMLRRMRRKESANTVDLPQRARQLSVKYGLRTPQTIRWVSNQETLWGSCTPARGTIRISDRLAREPVWVIDYVVVHELAHLSHLGHGQEFWDLVYRYPLTERARGFLMARGLGDTDDDDQPEGAVSGGPPADGRVLSGVDRVGSAEGGYRVCPELLEADLGSAELTLPGIFGCQAGEGALNPVEFG
jgi:predicted metal-dependent hydrolase